MLRLAFLAVVVAAAASVSTFLDEAVARQRRESPPVDSADRLAFENQLDIPVDLFPLIWPALASQLQKPVRDSELQEVFAGVRLAQLREWLTRAVEGQLAIRHENPIRYIIKRSPENQLRLALDLEDDGDSPNQF